MIVHYMLCVFVQAVEGLVVVPKRKGKGPCFVTAGDNGKDGIV